ncbi:AP-4 complex subunit epsilon-like [Camellia sinensis]|uniref:AP-4 complex subunit epsilon-like n=1 Tax=Camellia sinensis TaxID=4442 RepID=UPI00103623A6|nr:AP-4 complex subunit epsilon-like [Camellia sinensis]
MGIDALGRLIKISPEIAEQHQLAVIDCLEDPDDTLKRKTFELLYKMTKSSNVEVIVDRMIDYVININDNHYKTEIASRCVELAEQFAPSNQWFIQTMNRVFEHAGDLVNIKVAHNLMRLIAEGFGEDDDTADSQLRSSAVESYLHIIGEPKLPSAFLQVHSLLSMFYLLFVLSLCIQVDMVWDILLVFVVLFLSFELQDNLLGLWGNTEPQIGSIQSLISLGNYVIWQKHIPVMMTLS